MPGSAAELLQSVNDVAAEADATGFAQIERQVPSARSQMLRGGEFDALSELVRCLVTWSERCTDHGTACQALLLAADLARIDLRDNDYACELYECALRRDPVNPLPIEQLRRTLEGSQQWERLESAYLTWTQSLDECTAWEVELRVKALCDLASLREQHLGDLDTAVLTYQQALDLDEDPSAMLALAELYLRRDQRGDHDEAAELFYALGDRSPSAGAIPLLERALDARPDHDEALTLLQALTEQAEAPGRGAPNEGHANLEQRMHAFAASAPAGDMRDSIEEELAERGSVAPPPAPPSPEPQHAASVFPASSGSTQPFSAVVFDERALERFERAAADLDRQAAAAPSGAVEAVGSWAPTLPAVATPAVAVPALAPGAGGASPWSPPNSLSPVGDIGDIDFSRKRGGAPWLWIGAAVALGAAALLASSPDANQDTFGDSAKSAAAGSGPSMPAAQEPSAAVPKVPIGDSAGSAPKPHVELVTRQLELHGTQKRRGAVLASLVPARLRLEQCYAETLGRNGQARGDLAFSFEVHRGKATRLRPRGGSLDDPQLKRCALRALRAQRFPRVAAGPGAVRAVFSFAPQD